MMSSSSMDLLMISMASQSMDSWLAMLVEMVQITHTVADISQPGTGDQLLIGSVPGEWSQHLAHHHRLHVLSEPGVVELQLGVLGQVYLGRDQEWVGSCCQLCSHCSLNILEIL